MRLAAKRDTVEQSIVDALEAAGCSVQRLSAKGVPDLLVGVDGLTFLMEVKTNNAVLTIDQEAWFCGWKGQTVHIVRTPAQALKAIRWRDG